MTQLNFDGLSGQENCAALSHNLFQDWSRIRSINIRYLLCRNIFIHLLSANKGSSLGPLVIRINLKFFVTARGTANFKISPEEFFFAERRQKKIFREDRHINASYK